MCRRKPGPRCHSHGRFILLRERSNLKKLRRNLNRLRRNKNPDANKIAQAEARVEKALNNAYTARRYYYSTPRARAKLETEELPQQLRDIRHKELAVVRTEDEVADLQKEVASKGGNTKANQEALEAAQRKLASHREKLHMAQTQYEINRAEVYAGEQRWESAKTNLQIQERRDIMALEVGDFHRAMYSESDLEAAEDWERISAAERGHIKKPKYSVARQKDGVRAYHTEARKAQKDERLVRHIELETPTFEKATGSFEVRVVKDRRTGMYVAVANTKNMELSRPSDITKVNEHGQKISQREDSRSVGRSALPNWARPPRNQRKGIDLAPPVRIPDDTTFPISRGFKSPQEAAQAAQQWVSSAAPAKTAAKMARQNAIDAHMSRAGYKTVEARQKRINELVERDKRNQLITAQAQTLF